MTTPALSLDCVSKIYARNGQRIAALDGVSLAVDEREFVFIVGPSGSGKSTLLLTIGGLVRPSSGRVSVRGTFPYELPVRQRARLRLNEIGFVFQTFNLVPYLTARENVQIPLCLAGKGRREQGPIADDLLERLGISDRAGHLPAELSVGERQRVALARAIANEPALLLADEPTGNLDPERSEEVMGLLGELHRNGMTVLIVSHDPRFTERADKVIRLVSGRLQDGSRSGGKDGDV